MIVSVDVVIYYYIFPPKCPIINLCVYMSISLVRTLLNCG